MSPSVAVFVLAVNFALLPHVGAQINLGTININKNPRGDLEFGVGQSANLFGFGGDRQVAFTAGPGVFDTKLGGGALIGGERLGLDGNVGVREGQALNLGSMLNFGNAPPNPNDPAGALNSFINNVGYFFQRFSPPAGAVAPSTRPRALPAPTPRTSLPNSGEAEVEEFLPAASTHPTDLESAQGGGGGF